MAMTRSLPTADSAGLSIVDERLIQSGEIVSNTSGVTRTGVLPTHTGALVTALPSRAVSVAAFVGVFSRTGAGVEKAANNAATTVPIDPAPNSNARIDVIWARCQFTASTDANNLAVLGVTPGDAAQDPVKKAIPAGAIELATVLFPAGATTTQSNGVIITPTHQYTAMEGGCVLLRSQAEMDAWTPHDGSPAYRLDIGQAAMRENGAWAYEEAGTFTFGTLYRNHNLYQPMRLTRRGKRVRLRGALSTNQTVAFNANTVYPFGTVPVGWRPPAGEQAFGVVVVSAAITTYGWAIFATNGELQIAMQASFSSTGDLGMVLAVDLEWNIA